MTTDDLKKKKAALLSQPGCEFYAADDAGQQRKVPKPRVALGVLLLSLAEEFYPQRTDAETQILIQDIYDALFAVCPTEGAGDPATLRYATGPLLHRAVRHLLKTEGLPSPPAPR